MIKNFFKMACLVFVLLLSAMPLYASERLHSDPDAAKLFEERDATCWVEGMQMGDMMIGARASLEFIYLDGKLSAAISSRSDLAQWLDDYNQYYGSPKTKGKAIFLIRLKTNKPMTFDPSKVFVADYHIANGDMISSSIDNPSGDIASEDEWKFVCVVPAGKVKRGSVVKLGYGEYSVDWRVPE